MIFVYYVCINHINLDLYYEQNWEDSYIIMILATKLFTKVNKTLIIDKLINETNFR